MSADALSTTAKKNIEAIAQVERELLGRRSRVEKIGDVIARFFGSLWFIGAHVLFFTLWIVENSVRIPSIEPFDPYPFPFLGLIVGIEFIFLTTFVLMNQNMQSKRQDHWGHMSLQVCLLTEQEVTKNMKMLHQICRQLGLENSSGTEAANELVQETSVVELVAEIEKAREQNKPVAELEDWRSAD